MERIKRALERAKAERESVLGQTTPVVASAAPALAAVETHAAPPGAMATRTRTQPINLALMREGGLLLPGMVGAAAHSFKMLRTQVMQRMKSRGWNTLAVMSAAPDEGKTFVATNLAIAIAADPDSTALLVDLDLRAPRLHRRFGFEPDAGVEDCLRGEAELAAALVNPEGYSDLLLLPARGPVEHSSELLASSRARSLIREVKERYTNRVVIYDLPPMLGSDDALTFAPQVDAVLVVVGDERTKREELLRCFELIREIPVVGTVLNGSRRERSSAYAY